MEAKGKTGQIQFDGQYLTITRQGLMARSIIGGGEKRLHVSQISAVQWKPAGAIGNGFIQFTLPGGNERRSRAGRQGHDAIRDENSVVFNRAQEPAFAAIRQALDAAIAAQHAPQPSAASVSSMADELAKLGALVQQGVLTPEEFVAAKARLLS